MDSDFTHQDKMNGDQVMRQQEIEDQLCEQVYKLALAVKRFEDETDGENIFSDVDIVCRLKELLKFAQEEVENCRFGDAAALHGLPLILWKIAENIDVKRLFTCRTRPPYELVTLMVTLTWLIGTATNASKLFCLQVEVEAAGILPWMLTVATSKLVRQGLHDKQLWELVDGCLTSFLNIAKLPETRESFVKIGSIDALSFYLTSPNDDLKCLVMIFIAHLVGDSDSARLADKFGVTASLTNFLKTAVKNSNRSFSGLSVEELTEGIGLLLINDANKPKFVAAGILPLLDDLLDAENRLEQSRAIDCIWALAFGKEERKQIRKETKIVKKLQNLAKTSEDEEIRIKASNSLTYLKKSFLAKAKAVLISPKTSFLVEDSDSEFGYEYSKERSNDTQGEDNKGDKSNDGDYLFVSYCHKQQKNVLRIREALQTAGYNVWIDVDKMHGSTLQAEAEAIEKSSGAIVCFSEDYSKSNACRAEAEYIYKLQKPFIPVRMVYGFKADGWLGILLGAQLYVDIASSKMTFQQALLVKQIEMKMPNLMRRSFHNVDSSIPGKAEPVDKPKPINNENDAQESIANWTSDGVRKWLIRENLQHFAKCFGTLDGRMLEKLREMKFKAPEAYYTVVSKQVGNNIRDSLLLLDALDRLWLTVNEK